MLKGGLRQMQRRGFITLVAAAFVFIGFHAMGEGSARGAEGCPNEGIRIQQGASELPGCRAYEMVTPIEKGSGEPEFGSASALTPSAVTTINGIRASVDGERLAWASEPVPGAQGFGVSHLSSRGGTGWTSGDIVPSMAPANDLLCPLLMGVSGWSTDLTRSVLDLPAGPPAVNALAPRGFREEEECGNDEPRLIAGEPEHFRNLFVRDNIAGSYALVNITPDNVVWPEPEENLQPYWPASFLAGSDDLSHVVFEEELALTPDAPLGYRGGNELYEWAGGQVRLVTILPDGTPVHGALAGATRNYFAGPGEPRSLNVAQFRHAVSANGSRILFEAEGGLYLRKDGSETFQVDASHGSDPSGGGTFMVASADGSRIFFTAERRLTSDSTAGPGQPDLYEYRLNPDDSSSLVDLTVTSGEPANVLGVSGASHDGDRVYFVARGILSAVPNSAGDLPAPGEANLYLAEGGGITFVATLDASDDCDWKADESCGVGLETSSGLTARVSTDGSFLGFNSVRSLTGYDNSDPSTGEPHIEIFLYDASNNELNCASCNPSGMPATEGAAIRWPSNPGQNGNWSNAYPQRNVSDKGQVFFHTSAALVPRDGNGVRDVYEYADGALRLISTGSGSSGFHFLDATPDGGNVFLATAQALLSRDIDSQVDYYDARARGGFLEPPPPTPSCDASSCRAAEPGGAPPTAGTDSFVGPGDVVARKRKKRCRPVRHRRSEGKRHRQSEGQRTYGPLARKCKRRSDRKGGSSK
jgi:hypothetical protein